MSTSKNLKLTICVGALLAPFLLGSAGADDQNKNNQYSASLVGFEEIPSAILSPGRGNLTLNVAKDGQSINFNLKYSGFINNITQSHIHFGKEHVAVGIMVFFCTNLTVPPPAAPATIPQPCPLGSGTVSGTLTPSDVIGPTGQNIKIGDFTALLAALKSNTAYGNIHTTAFPSGEIRGQIQPSQNDD